MTKPALFREEALAFRTGQQRPAAVLRVVAPWVRWLYWGVLALLVVGLALAYSVRTAESASGPALINSQEGTFTALLPEAVRADLEMGHPLRIEVDGLPDRRGNITLMPRDVLQREGRVVAAAEVLRAQAANDADARRAGFDAFPQPAVLVSGLLSPEAADVAGLPSSPRLAGRAVVVLRTERLLTVFLRGFEGVLGGGET